MRPTLLGSLLDAARHNVAARRRGPRALRVRARSTARATGDGRCADEHHALGALLQRAARRRASWRGDRRRRPDFFAAKALLAALLDALRVDWSVRAERRWPFLHPGRSAAVLRGRTTRPRLRRRAAPARRARLGPRARGRRVRARPRQGSSRWRPRSPPFRDRRRASRRCARTSRSSSPRTSAADACSRAVRGAGGELLRDVTVFDVYTRRAGRRGPRARSRSR